MCQQGSTVTCGLLTAAEKGFVWHRSDYMRETWSSCNPAGGVHNWSVLLILMCWLILILQRSVFQSKGEREENVFIKYTSTLQRNRTKGLFMAALKQSLGECNNEVAFTMLMCAAFTFMLALAEGSTFFSPHFCETDLSNTRRVLRVFTCIHQ